MNLKKVKEEVDDEHDYVNVLDIEMPIPSVIVKRSIISKLSNKFRLTI